MTKVKTKTFEIYFEDLEKETQSEILAFFKLRNAEEMNWDAFPCCQITMEVKDESR